MRQNYKNINIDNLRNIVNTSDSLVEVTNKLGFNPKIGSAKRNIERLIKRNKISIEHFSTVKRVREYTQRYNKKRLMELVQKYNTLKEILLELDILPIESNYKTLKKYLKKYEINYSHIINRKRKIIDKYEEINLRKTISTSYTFNEVLNKLKLNFRGASRKWLQKYVKIYNIDTSHFCANKISAEKVRKFNTAPLNKILIENSTYNNGTHLKKRLYEEGLKLPKCEECGQDENWRGKHISLILDHINGMWNDNRIKNLRILCPNCNATLPTHCGKNIRNKKLKDEL